jgi:hypothetical protein
VLEVRAVPVLPWLLVQMVFCRVSLLWIHTAVEVAVAVVVEMVVLVVELTETTVG